MIKDALEWVRAQTRPETIQKGDRQYVITAAGGVAEIGGRPTEDAISVSTLTGFADAVKRLGALQPGQVIAVGGPPSWTVELYAEANETDRYRDLVATCSWPGTAELARLSGPPGAVVLEAQVAFDRNEERDRLLRSLQSIVDVSEVRVADDGVNQEVSGKARVGVDWGKVENPFHLQPRVIYDEVEAPVCPYVLRFEKKGDQPGSFTVHLVPIKGTCWQTEGIRSIVAKLRELLPIYQDAIVG